MKYIDSTSFNRIIAIKRYNDGLVLLTGYPHHLFRVNQGNGNVEKQFVIVAADNSSIDIFLDTERANNNDFQSMFTGHIIGAQDTKILRIIETKDLGGYAYDHSWTLSTGSNLEIQAVATFGSLQVATTALKYELAGMFHYGFVEVDYSGGTNTQRYLQTQAISDDFDLMVADYNGADQDVSAFIGHNSAQTELVGFAIDFANSEIKSFGISRTGS